LRYCGSVCAWSGERRHRHGANVVLAHQRHRFGFEHARAVYWSGGIVGRRCCASTEPASSTVLTNMMNAAAIFPNEKAIVAARRSDPARAERRVDELAASLRRASWLSCGIAAQRPDSAPDRGANWAKIFFAGAERSPKFRVRVLTSGGVPPSPNPSPIRRTDPGPLRRPGSSFITP
jgi:hypothetical protein